MNMAPSKQLFELGIIVATPACLLALGQAGQLPLEFLTRHAAGDWGDCEPDDAIENELSIKEGFRIFSVYQTRLGTKVWVITEADRSSTCVLLPSEY